MKPLKILLANNTLSLLAGSETWTYTLAIKLKELGHKVSCFSPELGIISQKLVEKGITCFDSFNLGQVKPFSFILEETIDHDYDIIIANHNHIVEYLRSVFPKKPIISTIHGIIHLDSNGQKAPEHPALDSGVNQFVSVSEEVQKKLKKDHGIDSIVIRNFFDIAKYKSLKAPSVNAPKQFLINTNYADKSDAVVQSIRDAAKIMGVRVSAVGANFAQQFDLTKAIEDSDVVFGMGRSVLEGVAAGRLGIVYGRWGMGGPVVESKIEELRHFNFSGRNSGEGKIPAVDPKEIIDMVNLYYKIEHLDWGRQYVARDHNVTVAAEQYIRLARELTGQLMTRPASSGGVDPLAKKFKLQSDVA